jgi:hypothetical protein
LAGALMKKLHCLWLLLELLMVGRTVPLAAIENRSKHAFMKIDTHEGKLVYWSSKYYKLYNN